ncbi:MAG TPA: GTPase ObgE [Candidatus Peribacteraceae bacterium]|nr:GTPase ObgE [Candidatus Peribacteraceae bacterium]
MFLDEAIIEVAGGDGGRGCVSWRREKYIPKGGPDGGDGGRGANIVFIADPNTDTLTDFTSRKRFEGEKGRFGSGSNRAGKDAEDLVLKVPPGTTISEQDEKNPKTFHVIADLKEPGDRVIAAFGGRGGYGNAHFASSTRQRPDFAELGEPGERKMLKLELKLIADVGIIGYPSVGKSTLISVISAARPKIADYPFTTLVPNLGVVQLGERSYVVCDIPGLIEGASEGKGLGHQFLRHIERCGVLLHLLDIGRALEEENKVNVDKLVEDYNVIRSELTKHSPLLGSKRELVLLNKIDLIGGDTSALEKELKKRGIEIFLGISAATKLHTDELVQKLLPIVLEERTKRETVEEEVEQAEAKELPVLRPQQESMRMGAYKVQTKQDGTIIVSGKRLEQFTKMTNFDAPGGLQRFRDVVDRIGLAKVLRREMKEDSIVYIGSIRVDSYL